MGLAQKMAQASAAPAAGAPSFTPPQQQQQQQQFNQQQPPQGYPAAPPSYDQYAQQAPAVPNGRPGSYQQLQQGQYAPPAGPPPAKSNNPFASDLGRSSSVSSNYSQQPHSPAPGGYQAPYGAPPPQQQQQYQQAPPQSPAYGQPPAQPQQHIPGAPTLTPQAVESILQHAVRDQHIEAFYPPGSLTQLAQQVASSPAIGAVATQWKLPLEIASDLVKLALFDVCVLVDDSGSMAFEEEGSRIDDLKLILERAVFAASLFDTDGISVRFLNSPVEGNGIRDAGGAMNLLQQIRYSGLTPLGTSMDRKILEPLVLNPARAGRLQKPVLVITITDGTPAGEPRETIFNVIQKANRELQHTRYGADAISFQFALVGNDQRAQQFLGELDTHPVVGGLVDCISPYEAEQEEMMRKSGFNLTPDLYIMKLLMGGIDTSYDEQDE